MNRKSTQAGSVQAPSVEEDLLARIDPNKLPRHVGIIMDGNGRWARQRGFKERIRGHEAAIESVRAVTRAAGELGVRALTLYAFSTENWNRPREEIDALMGLLGKALREEADELNESNVRLLASGHIEGLPQACVGGLRHTIEATAQNTKMVLNLALNYGGRSEILHAVRQIAQDARDGRLDPDKLDENDISSRLCQPQLGDPDLIIRTSGEYRISNFLIWQSAYSELYITPVLWPDFRGPQFLEAIIAYQSRSRRFGTV
jgi:undecaprenyl diphosphate synthase